MKLRKLEIRNLYGEFTKTIEFNPKLNLLVGINGSGKTSILNCIDWLLRPDVARLAVTPFDVMRLHFSHSRNNYIIQAKQENGILSVSEESGNTNFPPFTVLLDAGPISNRSERDLSEMYQAYKTLGPEPHERKMWKFLNELPQPLTITLDRSISAETDDEIFYEVSGRGRVQKSKKAKLPLEKVVDVTRNKYTEYRQQIFTFNEELKAKLVVSAFRNPLPSTRGPNSRKISLSEISKLEKKVTALLSTSLGIDESESRIRQYFNSAKEFAQISEQDESFRSIFWSQFRQIDDLAAAFDSFERKSSQAFDALGSYLKTLNSFFVDSNKAIVFSEHDGSLSFQFLNNRKDPSGPYRPIDRLSSGERQILILLTFLAFVSNKDHVFVVDEPELSLHPRWQENFLGAILSQSPLETQIILATHSPEIVASHRSDCIVLDA